MPIRLRGSSRSRSPWAKATRRNMPPPEVSVVAAAAAAAAWMKPRRLKVFSLVICGPPLECIEIGKRRSFGDSAADQLEPVQVEQIACGSARDRPEYKIEPVSPTRVGDRRGLAGKCIGAAGIGDSDGSEERPVRGIEAELDDGSRGADRRCGAPG